jgi:hypothetical protein
VQRPRSGSRAQFALFLVWLGPGAVVSWFLKASVPWVTFMSLYAIVISHWTAYQSTCAKLAAEDD